MSAEISIGIKLNVPRKDRRSDLDAKPLALNRIIKWLIGQDTRTRSGGYSESCATQSGPSGPSCEGGDGWGCGSSAPSCAGGDGWGCGSSGPSCEGGDGWGCGSSESGGGGGGGESCGGCGCSCA